MIYFKTKSDLQFMEEFKANVLRLFEMKAEVKKNFKPSVYIMGKDYHDAVLNKATESNEGKILREKLAQEIPKAIEIAYRNGVSIDYKSLPAPAIGGAIIPVNIFYAILEDTSYDGIDERWIVDKINETIGQLKRRLQNKYFKLINPFFGFISFLFL